MKKQFLTVIQYRQIPKSIYKINVGRDNDWIKSLQIKILFDIIHQLFSRHTVSFILILNENLF